MRLVAAASIAVLSGSFACHGTPAWADKGGAIETVEARATGPSSASIEATSQQRAGRGGGGAHSNDSSEGRSSPGTGAGGSSGPEYPQHVLDDPGLLSGAMSPDEVVQAQCTMLAVTGQTDPMCQPAAAGPAPAGAPPPPPDPREVARRAVLQLEIPAPDARIGPDPTVNEWKMAVVGYPLWLWVSGPDRIDRTVTEQGITLNLTARRATTKFDLGDGTVKFCGVTTPYHSAVPPGAESPSCGHRYQRPSLPGGRFAVSATTRWEVSWSALGQSGVLPLERRGPVTQLPVGELVSVRTGG